MKNDKMTLSECAAFERGRVARKTRWQIVSEDRAKRGVSRKAKRKAAYLKGGGA
jgi:hypothetical protein